MDKKKFDGKGAVECKAVDWETFAKHVDSEGNVKKEDSFEWDVKDVDVSWSIEFDENGHPIDKNNINKNVKTDNANVDNKANMTSAGAVNKTPAMEELSQNIVNETLTEIAREGILKADGAFVTGEIDAKAVAKAAQKTSQQGAPEPKKAVSEPKKAVSKIDERSIRKSVDDKIVIKSEELKGKRLSQNGKKVKIRVKKSDAKRNREKDIELQNDVTASPYDVKINKYKNLGMVGTDVNEASKFRKQAANWRYDNVSKADTTDEQIEETNANLSFIDKIKMATPVQYIAAAMALVILITGVMTTGVYADYRGEVNKAAAFAALPSFNEADTVAYDAGFMEEEIFMEEAAAEMGDAESKNLSLVLTSVEKDLKIKLVNDEDTLVKGILWGVTVTDDDGDESSYEDEDEDGIIYITGIKAGDYTVAINPSSDLEGYNFPTIGQEVCVKAKVEYKVIANIKEEIKKESEVNVALEDPNGNQAADVETGTAPADTVAFVESTQKEDTNATEEYEEAHVDLTKTEKIVALRDRLLIALENVANSTKRIFDRNNVLANVSALVRTVADNEGAGVPGFGNNEWVQAEKANEENNVEPSNEVQPTPVPEITPEPTPTLTPIPEATPIVTPIATPTPTPTPTPEAVDNTVKSVRLNSSSKTLKKDEQFTLSYTCEPSSASYNSVEWGSDDVGIATVSNGTVTAVGYGSTRVYVYIDQRVYAYCDITVVTDGNADGTVVLSGPVSVKVDESVNIEAKCTPSTDYITEWVLSDASIAKIAPNGSMVTVTGVAVGKVTVKARSASGIEATFDIDVKESEGNYADDAQLYDSNKNKLYVLDGNEYRLAKYSDYKDGKFTKFYRKKSESILYTGWQTIDGVTYYFTEDHEKVTGEQVIGGVKYVFGDDGALSRNSGILGIDVSKYQPSINWNSVKASGINYVIIRCGYRGASTGSLIQDPYFTSHISGAKSAGLKVGVYFFSTALNETEAVEEASMCAALCSGYGINYPIFIDVESSTRPGYNGLSASQRTANIKAFCSTIQSAGYTPGLYANKTWLTSYINTSSLSCKIWLAQYNAAGPTYNGHYDLWQYTSKGKVDGISGNVDMNQSYLGY